MIQHLKYHQINRDKWDLCIEKACQSLPYGFSWYLDIICEKWDALVMDDYHAVFPLPYRKKAGIKYLFQPFFAQQLGPFFPSEEEANQTDTFLEAIPGSFRFAEIFLNSKAFPNNHLTQAFDNYELCLNLPMSRIRHQYSQNLVRNLKKANQHGMHISPHPNLAEIIRLFRRGRGKEVKHWGEKEYHRFTRLYHTAEHLGRAKAWGVYNPVNELIAGAVFLFGHQRCILLFSATDGEGKKLGAMPLLLDHVIHEFELSEMTFDFEGSMDLGLARFYASFGATRTSYWFYRFNRLPFPLNLLKK